MELTSGLWSTDVVVALIVASLIAAPFLHHLFLVFLSTCWTPLRIKRAFEAQRIATLPFRFLHGNNPEVLALKEAALRHPMPCVSHDISPRLLPHCYHWAQKYGIPYVYWLGSEAQYNVTNVEDAKDILSTKSGHYPKPDLRPDANALLGYGLVTLQGEKWAQHRRMLNPAFFLDKLKAMIPTMEACTMAKMEDWASFIEKGQAVDVQIGLRDLTADIIAHTAFGSSFAEGKRVFDLQCEQIIMMAKVLSSTYIPGARFLPTPFNRHAWKIDKDMQECLRTVINKREELVKSGREDSYGHDLLGLMMAANKNELQKNLTMDINEIIDECKTFFFAGHDSTASFLTWVFLLLATSPEWQTRTREELIAVCGATDTPTPDTVNHLKIVRACKQNMYTLTQEVLDKIPLHTFQTITTSRASAKEAPCTRLGAVGNPLPPTLPSRMGMILNETLRLYPPAIMTTRKASTDVHLGEVVIPKGTVMTLPFLLWHHDERYWGADANEFRPERFSEGVMKASKVPGAFMPFSMGPRVCIGQNFALLEAKVVLSTILRRYRIRLSPTYKHAPFTVLTLQPQFGMPILFEEL